MKRMFLVGLGCAAMLLAAGLPTRGQGPATRPAAPTTRSRNEWAQAKLTEPVPFCSPGGSLENILDLFPNTTGVPLTVDWPALEKVGVTRKSEVTIELLGGPSAALGLRYILRSVAPEGRLIYRIENGAVVITTPRPGEIPLPPPPADDNITKMLKANVSVNTETASLRNAMDYLRNSEGLQVFEDWISLKSVGVTPDTPVTLRLDKTPMSTVLDKVLQAAGGDKLQWTVEGNVVVIAAKTAGAKTPGAGAATQPGR